MSVAAKESAIGSIETIIVYDVTKREVEWVACGSSCLIRLETKVDYWNTLANL